MKKIVSFALLAMTLSCQQTKNSVLYESEAFTVYADKVVQGKHEAVAISPAQINSNYKSPVSETFSPLITFKCSINQKDNELPAGVNHWIIIGDEHESPVITFGETPAPQPEKPESFLPVNFAYTFRINMGPVLRQFEEKGYYEACDGSKVAKTDFKGFYIAGGSEPLSWDFVNLDNKGLALQDPDKDSIYTITVQFNPYDENENTSREWKPEKDLAAKPSYHSDQPMVDALFNLSLEEALKNIEADSTFRTGAKWGGVWTRDISYSIFLAFAYHEPRVAMISLMKKVKRKRIVQDTGSGGAWPVSSDRTVWAIAAWEIYKVTGDFEWLKQAYEIIRNTLEDDYKVLYTAQTGMYRGESSFLDWREQTYPKWMSNMDIYVSQNLGTNVVHYQANMILAEMANILNQPAEIYVSRATAVKEGINKHLWMNDKGYYAQYLYGRNELNVSPRFEALGEALSVLFNVADVQKANTILEQSPVTAFGVTCIYPQIPGIPPYHNNAVWPFVQAFWNLAAAKTGNEAALNHGMAAMYRAAGLFLTNYENFVASSGDFMGTEINSDRMLWSMAGNLAMVHRVLMGISFETDGIRFSPVIPSVYRGKKTLSNFKYRNAVLSISVNGTGNEIASIQMDGKDLADAFLPANTSGNHTIEITMDNNDFIKKKINMVKNQFSLPDPQAKLNGGMLEWKAVDGAAAYAIYKNGKQIEKITSGTYPVTAHEFAEYKVSAIDKNGIESFTSEPVLFADENTTMKIEAEDFTAASTLAYVNFSGKGFAEISNTTNRTFEFTINTGVAGEYLIDFRYSNGSGPWNTDNKCAIRSLYTNNAYTGALVFPQRGTDEWSDWGYSNSYTITLAKGANKLKLVLEEWNINMNADVNTAMIDYVRLIKK